MRGYFIFIFLLLIIGQQSCIKVPEQFDGPPPGKWRGVLNLDGIRRPLNVDAKPKKDAIIQFEEVTRGELPFLFELEYAEEKGKMKMTIHNAEERIVVDDVIYGWNRSNGDDTVRIDFPHYDSYITAFFEEGVIEGQYIVKTKKDYSIPFLARNGQDHLFTSLEKEPVMDVSGKWEVEFGIDTEDPYPAIGEFKQDGNRLTGTFITETGDYRYLDGTIQKNKIYLSCFDGSHAFLFEAKIQEDKSMIGSFRSGSHYETAFSAKKNPEVQLGDPNKLTYLKEGYDKLSFSFPNENGGTTSLNDDAFKGKYKIIQILGTWCPNCGDETAFLSDYFKNNPREDVAVIGLAFEKHKEKEKAFAAIKKFKERFGINYPVLWAGNYKKALASEQLPMLNRVISYPTMIFLDKNNQVLKIHTGFYGPATSKYKAFTEEFDEFLKGLE